jgi:hypothetical protein
MLLLEVLLVSASVSVEVLLDLESPSVELVVALDRPSSLDLPQASESRSPLVNLRGLDDQTSGNLHEARAVLAMNFVRESILLPALAQIVSQCQCPIGVGHKSNVG